MKLVPLKELAKVDWGNTSLTKSSYIPNGEFIAVSATGCDGRINHAEHQHGTLVLSAIGANCGKMFLPESPFTAIKNTITIIPKDSIDSKYLFWFLNNFQIGSRGAGQPFITKSDTEKKLIPLPPLVVQQKITNILDAADALRQNEKALIAKYDELTQALFLDMFGDPVSNPMGWEKFEFSKVAKNENSKRVPVKQSDRDKREGEYPYYGATGIIDTIDDYKFDGEFLLIAEDGKNLLFRKKNNAFIAKGKFWVNNHAHVLSPNGVTDLRYLEFFLNSIDFGPYISGIDQIKLNKESLNKIPVPVPPINLQNQFAERVTIIEEQKAIAQKSLEQSESLFNSLLQKAFKGELI